MKICKKCQEVLVSVGTLILDKRGKAIHDQAFILCCDWPDPMEIERKEIITFWDKYDEHKDYEEKLEIKDLTDKEQLIFKYLIKEGQLKDDSKIFTGESTDSMVRDKQLWFNFL